ncbi:MAG TPA: hypothetical protein VMZ90_10470 [Vicinamibacterales bacterium]|nr:hypothetical protein [Vicinamibacterales bacterium]
MRIALGLLAATVATPLAIALMWGALWYAQVEWFEGQPAEAVIENIRLYAMLSAPIALFVTLAAGGPIAHQLAHRGHRSALKYILLGAVLGALPFLLFESYIMGTNLLLYVSPAPNLDTVINAVRWAGLGAWCGMWSAAAYWAVAVRERHS